MGNQSKGLIALLQLNPTVGDIVGNAERLQEMVNRAQSHGASACVSTELAICGYPPRDLLMQPSFIQIAQEAAMKINVDIPVLPLRIVVCARIPRPQEWAARMRFKWLRRAGGPRAVEGVGIVLRSAEARRQRHATQRRAADRET